MHLSSNHEIPYCIASTEALRYIQGLVDSFRGNGMQLCLQRPLVQHAQSYTHITHKYNYSIHRLLTPCCIMMTTHFQPPS